MAVAKARRIEEWQREAADKAQRRSHRLGSWTRDGRDVLRSSCQNGGCVASVKMTTSRRGGLTGSIVDRDSERCPIRAAPRLRF